MLRLAVILMMAAPFLAAAQAADPVALENAAPLDTMTDTAGGDSSASTATPAAAPLVSPAGFAAILLGGVIANAAFEIQRDPGGYEDLWYTRDKRVHVGLSLLFTEIGERLGVDRRASALMVCGAGALFEYSQAMGGGHVSTLDIHANCLGAALPVLWSALRRD